MPLGGPSLLPGFGTSRARDREVTLVALPPGTYRLASWRVGATTKGLRGDHAFAQPFKIGPGQVVMVGWFEGRTEVRYPITEWTLRSRAIFPEDALTLFRARYPRFEKAVVTCWQCGPEAPERRRIEAELPELQLRPRGGAPTSSR